MCCGVRTTIEQQKQGDRVVSHGLGPLLVPGTGNPGVYCSGCCVRVLEMIKKMSSLRAFFVTHVLLALFFAAYFLITNYQHLYIYSCGDQTKTFLPASAFLLPEPRVCSTYGTHTFARPQSTRHVYYFHGNGGSVRDTYWHIGRLYSVCNCTIHALETPRCLYDKGVDQTQTVEHLTGAIRGTFRHGSNQSTWIMGVSLGTAHALHTMAWWLARNVVSGVVLENPFTSLPDMVPWWLAFLRPLLLDDWNSTRILDEWSYAGPILFLTSEQDEIVPSHMSTTLMDVYRQRGWGRTAAQVLLKGSLHGHAGAHPDYLPAIASFILRATRVAASAAP